MATHEALLPNVDYMWNTHPICDPLSENPAHCAFYENRDKTGNQYTNV